MRNSTMTFANKVCITIALCVLVVALATCAFIGIAPTSNLPVAQAALTATTTTTLDSGLGVQYGSNYLRTNTDDFYAGGIDANQVVFTYGATSGQRYITATGNAEIVTKPEVVAGNTTNYANMNVNTAVFYGILDTDITTTFEYAVTIAVNGNITSDIPITITAYFSADSTTGGKVESSEVTKEILIEAGQSYYTATQVLSFDVAGEVPAILGSHVNITTSVSSGGHSVIFSNPHLNVTATSHRIRVDGTKGLSLSISGKNRVTSYIPNVYSPSGAEQLAGLYVKEGDIITLRASYEDTDGGASTSQEFSPYYAAAFGRAGQSCIDYHTYYNGEYSRAKTYLQRVDEETHLYTPDNADPQKEYKYNTYQGFLATFYVTSGVNNATTLQIIPRTLRSLNGSTYDYWLPESENAQNDMTSYQITLNVDSSAPTAPKLDPTKSLGLAVANKVWFTDSQDFKLDYEYTANMDKTGIATERVYAFIVDTAFSDFPASYDFTPGTSYTYSYTAGTTQMTTRRQELGEYSNYANAEKSNISFNSGEYGLILYAIDDAGNVSSPTLYTPNQLNSPRVKVDASTKGVGAYIKYGTNPTVVPAPTQQNRAEFAKYTSVYVLIGSEYHDESGKCTYSPDNVQPNSAVDGLVSVKRGNYVTVRLIMNSNQYGNYTLVRYALDNSVGKDNPTYVENKQGNRIYDVTFKMDDDLWNANATDERPVSAYFHRRVSMRLLNDDFTYSFENNAGKKITFSSLMQAYFSDNPNNDPDKGEYIHTPPTIAVEYFKPRKISIISEYILNEDNQIVLQGGASVTIDGTIYDLGEDFNQNEFVRGAIPFEVGGASYYVVGNEFLGTINDGGIEYRNYELTVYDRLNGNTEGYSDAGTYYYRAYVVAGDSTYYYGEIVSSYVIKKADPGALDVFATNVLTYGQSLSDLIFSSYDHTNNEIPVSRVLAFNSMSYQQVSSGVYGSYVIIAPQVGSDNYERHNVCEGELISVEFRPIDLENLPTSVIKNNYEILKGYFDEIYNNYGGVIGYTLKEGVQSSRNYNNVSMAIPITIVHKSATVTAVSNTLEASYDGTPKSVEAYVSTIENGSLVYLENQPLIIEYKVRGESDATYTLLPPEQAGQYTVRIKIDDKASNYSSDYEIRDMLISKRELEISVAGSVTNHTILSKELTAGGVSSDEMLTYTYSHTQSAQYIAGYYNEGEFTQVGGVLYNYSFIKFAYYDARGNQVALDGEEWGEPMDVIGGSALSAGLYMMRVSLNNQNNAGEKYIVVDVKQVRSGDGISSLSISSPNVSTLYDLIDLDGTNHGQTAHLQYGQTLESMRDLLLGNRGSAKYTPRGTTAQVSIASRFVFETEEEYVNRLYNESAGTVVFDMDVNGYGEKVFPMNYNENGAIKPYDVRIWWQAGSVVDGEFVPNYNFRNEELSVSIFITRARPDFSEYYLSDLTYGQKVRESAFSGKITSNGYEFSASDFTITIPTETLDYMPLGGQNEILTTFTPSEDMIRNYLPLNNLPISLFVHKREVRITFATETIEGEDYDGNVYHNAVVHTYGKVYQMPAITITARNSSVSTQGIQPEYIYLRDYVEGEEIGEDESLYEYEGVTYVKMSAITTSTKVGKYYVLAKVLESEQNFVGEAFNTYFVVKGELFFNGIIPTISIEYGDNLMDVDFGNVLVVNDDLGNYNKYFYGTIKVAIKDGDNFIYDYLPAVDLSGEENVYLVFNPTGSQSVVDEYLNNYRPFEEPYVLRVDKRDLTDQIVITQDTVVFSANAENQVLTAYLKDPVTGDNLPLNINHLSPHFDAGEHPVEITVADSVQNYRAYMIATLNILKAPLTITNTLVEEIYNAKDHVYTPVYEVSLAEYFNAEFTFDIKYYNYLGHTLQGLPREVGQYVLEVTLVDTNFEEEVVVAFNVIPDIKGFNGLNQTYNPLGLTAITPDYNKIVLDSGEERNHPSVGYYVEYKDEFSDYLPTLPTKAGTYEVKFHFNERGYEKIYDLTMVVEKAEAVFIVSEKYFDDYTGDAKSLIQQVTLPESVTVANYFFKEMGALDDTYTSNEPTEAGLYEVKIVIEDENYEGEAHTTFEIRKGNLRVVVLPFVSSGGGSIPFNTPSSEVTFTYNEGDGMGVNLSDVQFDYDNTRVIKGKWVLSTDVSAYRVGERNVEVTFVPEDDNFNSVSTNVNVIIVQKDVSHLISFADEFVMEDGNYVISYEYSAKKIGVNPVLTENLAYGDNIYFTITYADSITQPTDVITENGEIMGYPVSVTLSDANYSGTINNVILKITPAINLDIIVPEMKNINKGEVLDSSYVIQQSGGVFIKSTGIAIEGTFSIVSDYRVTMDKANMQKVELQFIPSKNVDNVSTPRLTAYINVVGADLDLSNATLNITTDMTDENGNLAVPYGAMLSAYTISISGIKDGDGNDATASVRWANPNHVANVGDMVEYILTPEDTDNYNIKTLYATLTPALTKGEIEWSAESYVLLYEGQSVKEAIPYLKLYNQYLGTVAGMSSEQQAVYEISDFEYTLTASNPDYIALASDLGSYLQGITVSVTVTHPNYQTSTQEFPVFVKRLIKDFNVSNKSKYYDGEAVTISDLGISLVGTNYLPDEGDVVYKTIMLEGKKVDEIRTAGVYTVTIMISEDLIGENGTELAGSHEGEYTFTYTVNKRDLSEAIDGYFLNALNERVEFSEGTTYAEYVEFTAEFGSYEVDDATVKFNHYSANMSYSYGTLPPTDAGSYVVEISIRDNPYYVGSKTYTYSINKRVATITVDPGYYYTYNPELPVNIVPIVSNNVSQEYVQITYYPTGSNIGTTEIPVNVGSYSVEINLVNHPNMVGSASTRLTISTAPVVIEELPYVRESVKYGTMLKHVGIEGGVAEAVGGKAVSGKYAFENPEMKTLAVGTHSVTVVFTPDNSNYAVTTCIIPLTVVKATLSIEFVTLEKYYTGEALNPEINLDYYEDESGNLLPIPESDKIRRNFTYRSGNLNVPYATSAGVYEVTVTITDVNYEGTAKGVFIIHKAQAIASECVIPNVSAVTYGTSLKSGTITGGQIVYVEGKAGVIGSYAYLYQDTVLGDVGFYEGVEVVFTPADTANYENYVFPVTVEVVKALATISVSANNFVYGESIMSPVFTTLPLNLNVDNSTFENEFRGTIQRVGTYLFKASINEKNYKGELTYSIVVTKKAISIAYYRDNVHVYGYSAAYGTSTHAKAQIIADTLVGEDVVIKNDLENLFIYTYTQYNEEGKQIGDKSIVPPTARGQYKVTASIEHNDYYVDDETATVSYVITRAKVSSIEFDLESLSNQVYGTVSAPRVITTPANVKYVVEIGGYEDRIPTNAGNYKIKVTIQDDNYESTTKEGTFTILQKEISVEELKAYSKAYDGLPAIEVTGTLKGIMSGDDCDVKLFAHTLDNAINVGPHPVVIESWELYGLHARNYKLRAPIYNLSATITNKVITDPNTNSYITSPEGFSSNITVNFQEVYDTIDKTNFFTQMLGQKATVQVITIKENGLNTVLDSKVKFYVLIPEEYRDAKNLEVRGLGNLESAVITREGDYVTFYGDSSGEIIFYKNDFPYWIIIVGAVVGIIVLGVVFALIALPIRRRKRLPNDARRAYTWNQGLEGREHAFKKKVEQEIIEKKRRWRY